MADGRGAVGRRGASAYDAATLDRRVDMQHRYVLALEAHGASSALLAAAALLDGIAAERDELTRSELAPSLRPLRATARARRLARPRRRAGRR